jgi:hypothetical protein
VIVINNCTTGISEAITNSDFKVYPNPGKGSFIIETDNPPHLANDSVKIFDFFGNEVFSSTFNTGKTEIHLSSKLKGIYFLKLSRENTSDILKKIVIR